MTMTDDNENNDDNLYGGVASQKVNLTHPLYIIIILRKKHIHL